MTQAKQKIFWWSAVGACLLLCQGCGVGQVQQEAPLSTQDQKDSQRGRLFGKELRLFNAGPSQETLSVNPYLWQGALESLEFMGIEESDLSVGLLETRWYTPPPTPQERFKILVTVLGGRVRADGVGVHVLVQKQQGSTWTPQEASSQLAQGIREKILTKARSLKARAARG